MPSMPDEKEPSDSIVRVRGNSMVVDHAIYKKRRFDDFYEIDEDAGPIGEGEYGAVYKCTRIDDEEFEGSDEEDDANDEEDDADDLSDLSDLSAHTTSANDEEDDS